MCVAEACSKGLKAKAHAAGLLNLFVPHSPRARSLSNFESPRAPCNRRHHRDFRVLAAVTVRYPEIDIPTASTLGHRAAADGLSLPVRLNRRCANWCAGSGCVRAHRSATAALAAPTATPKPSAPACRLSTHCRSMGPIRPRREGRAPTVRIAGEARSNQRALQVADRG
jgi:hypothetical protein